MSAAHTAKKSALQDFGKVPTTDTVGFGKNLIFNGLVFLKTLNNSQAAFFFRSIVF